MRPRGWTEKRNCPWCGDPFIATTYMPKQRYCSRPKTCAAQAKAIVCTHYAEMGRKGRQAHVAKQDARWSKKIAGMTPLEAYKRGRRDGYGTRANLQYRRKKLAQLEAA
jgi:hypothetical protein